MVVNSKPSGGKFIFAGIFCKPSMSISYKIINFVLFMKNLTGCHTDFMSVSWHELG